MRRAEGAQRGFTLLEVLAAFLIFAVIFTVLAGTASQAFRAEGENRRRLEASLLADEIFANLERAARGGVVPESGENVEERDIFSITTVVTPLTAEELGLDLEAMREPRGGAQSQERRDTPSPATSLLEPAAGEESALKRIELVIGWEEGDRLVELRRATLTVDTSGLEVLAEQGEDNPLGGDDAEQDETAEDAGDDAEGRSMDELIRELDELGESLQ